MRRRKARPRLLALVLTTAFAGCAYVGGARPFDEARITREHGWTTATITEVRQADVVDCGPAALSMVAHRWNLPLSLEEAVAAVPEPTRYGTKLGHLRDAARARGLIAFAVHGGRQLLIHELRAGRPVVVGLLLPHRLRRVRSHYEVVVAVRTDTDEFVTVDPAAGWRVRSWSDLDAEWGAAGHPSLVVLGQAGPATQLE